MCLLALVYNKQMDVSTKKDFYSVSWSTYYLVVACTIYKFALWGSKYNKSQHRIKNYENNKQNAEQRELERASTRVRGRKNPDRMILSMLLLASSLFALFKYIRIIYLVAVAALLSLYCHIIVEHSKCMYMHMYIFVYKSFVARIIADSNVFVTV